MISTETAVKMEVALKRMDIRRMKITVIGESPLICHAWSQKAIDMMLDKQMKKAKAAREAKDPWMDFCDSLYWLSDRPAGKPTEKQIQSATFGFPCVGFKASAVGACRHVDGIAMTEARGAFHVVGELARLKPGKPTMRQDMVRVGMGTADVRFRGEFEDWSADLDIAYNANALSPEQIVNLFNVAGFGVGVGEWRPEKDGSYGRFRVG